MDLKGLVSNPVPLLQLTCYAGLTGGGKECRQPVLMIENIIDDRTRLDHSRPANKSRHAKAALPGRAFLSAERLHASVGIGVGLGTVVGRVDDDGVVGDTQIIELVEQLAHVMVVLHQAISVEAVAGLAIPFRRQACPHMHARGVKPDKERLVVLVRLVDEFYCGIGKFLVDGFHALARQWSRILNLPI